MSQLVHLRTPSGSSMDQAAACAPSHWLPRAGRPATVWGDRGKGVHDFLLRARDVGRDEALALIGTDEPHRKLCEVIPLESLPKGGHLEIAFAYDPETDTGRVLGENIDRKYLEHGLLPHEIPCTMDLVGVEGDTLIIPDWKSGFADLGPAVRAWQLRFGSLAACRALGFTKARAMFWFLREDGSTHGDDDVAEFDAFDLGQIASEVRDLVARLKASAESGRAETNAGPWCKYCECKSSCPSQVGMAQALMKLGPTGELTTGRASELWSRLEHYDAIAKQAWAELEEFAKHTPFPVAGGRMVKQVIGERKELDANKTLAALKELHGEEIAIKAMTIEASQEGIKRALRPLMKTEKVTLKKLMEDALDKIAALGGLKKIQTCSVKAVRDEKAHTITIRVEHEDGTAETL